MFLYFVTLATSLCLDVYTVCVLVLFSSGVSYLFSVNHATSTFLQKFISCLGLQCYPDWWKISSWTSCTVRRCPSPGVYVTIRTGEIPERCFSLAPSSVVPGSVDLQWRGPHALLRVSPRQLDHHQHIVTECTGIRRPIKNGTKQQPWQQRHWHD